MGVALIRIGDGDRAAGDLGTAVGDPGGNDSDDNVGEPIGEAVGEAVGDAIGELMPAAFSDALYKRATWISTPRPHRYS